MAILSSVDKASVLDPKQQAVYPGIVSTVDGSGAVVWVESHIAQGACAYPITPSTPMGDGFAMEFANGKQNLWGETLQFLEPESEHSSASACEGFALAGGRVTNFTSGQGLILMKEVLYVISGKRLPVVFHVGARALTSHSLNVHCGHDDVMGVADCGWGMLFGRNAQEAADLALIARAVAEETETPFLNIQDGFLTTHTLETVRLPEPQLMKEFVGEPGGKIRKLFDPAEPILSGCVQNQDSYMKGKVAQRYFYERVAPALERSMERFSTLTGRPYSTLRAYRMEDAEYAIIGMGSMMETAEATVDYLRAKGMRIGAVHITSFRPFPARQLAALVSKCRKISVIERADVPLAQSNPLTVEVKAALADAQSGVFGEAYEFVPTVYSGVAGLGGRDVRPGHFVAAAENMARLHGRSFFVLGVHHIDELPLTTDPDVRPAESFAMRGHSIGGFGSVTTNKVMASVSAELFGMHAQAFPKYGSDKKGLPTNYFLTLAPEHIRLHAELKQVDFVAIQDANAFLIGDPLAGLREGGVIYMQTPLQPQPMWESLPAQAKAAIRERKLELYVLDALKIARDCSSRADLQIRMQGISLLGAFLRLTPFREHANLSAEQLFQKLEQTLHKYFGKRGARVVADNLNAARRGYEEVVRVVPPEKDATLPLLSQQRPAPANPGDGALLPGDFCERILGAYARGQDNDLEADEALARSLMPAASAAFRSFRNLAPEIPEFLFEGCVGCMECVNECPDTAILAKVAEPAVLEEMLAKLEPAQRESVRKHFSKTSKYYDIPEKKGEKGGMFGIFVDPDKCKGCGECVVACGSHNALKMATKNGNVKDHDAALDLYRKLPETPARYLNEKALGDMMLADRALLYAGGAASCMGCGEATAIRMMLAATSFVYGRDQIGIVAATGCNSVYGSTYPYNPYQVPWTNSLFENAPADAMGVRLRWDQEGHQKRRLWVLGGDGAMYDIGFQSLSRMLMSGMDIKVLVLDTQVYSNTGGQTSTSTFTGQDAKMAQFGKAHPGKTERRKDLAQILMMHPGVFVAQTTAAHANHFYKSVMAANDYPGPAVIICYTTCQPEHGVADDHSMIQGKLVVESRTFPLSIYDPRKGERMRERLSLQGNPSVKEDWFTDPKTSQPVDFVAFAKTEGRFARHFNAEGQPDEFLKSANQGRLENWRLLQELAGVR